MAVPKKLKDLCPPALLYFIISIVFYVISIFQNLGNNNTYSVGHLTTNVPNTGVVFVVELIYILFWTYILNLICKDGYTALSWLLVLFPIVLLFVIIGMLMIEM